jgi:hypothetical protein
MRYFGEGIGHLSQLPGVMNRDAMDVDPPSSEANLLATGNLTPNESGHLTYQLVMVQQAISSDPNKGSEGLDVAVLDQDDDDEGVDADDDLDANDDNSDHSASESESDDDLGPEDREGIGNSNSDDRYASP